MQQNDDRRVAPSNMEAMRLLEVEMTAGAMVLVRVGGADVEADV